MKTTIIGLTILTFTQIESAFPAIQLTHFSEEEGLKIQKALSLIETIRSSEKFKTSVENFSYEGKREFLQNNNLSNEEIFQLVATQEIDLDLELYFADDHTVGYTIPRSKKIWINNKFFSVYSIAEVAGNLFHEWTHKLGFEHPRFNSRSRNATVPYALGNLVVTLGNEM